MRTPDAERVANVVGLIPAAGHSQRLSPLPCSKEIYPVGFQTVEEGRRIRPKVACHYLLEKMQSAGIRKIYIVIRPGKWDILAYLGDGAMLKVHLAYLIMDLPFGPPYSMNQAYPFVRDSLVAFGFPDIIFQTSDAFSRLLERQASTGADMVLGLFPIDPDRSDDRVDIDMEGRVRSITLGPTKSNSQYTWNIAVWTPAFTKFIHNHLAHLPANYDINKTRKNEPIPSELTVGAVIKDAFEKGLKIEGVSFPKDSCLDIGTPHDLVRAVKLYSDI